MRIFVLITSVDEVLKRRGVHARFVVASLLISRSIRRDAVSCFYLREGYVIAFYGSKMRQLRADEASAFGIVKKAVKSIGRYRNPHSGVYIYQMTLTDLVKKFNPELKLVRSDKQGRDIASAIKEAKQSDRTSNVLFITGLQEVDQLEEIRKIEPIYVKFPTRYSPEQEVAIVNMLLD